MRTRAIARRLPNLPLTGRSTLHVLAVSIAMLALSAAIVRIMIGIGALDHPTARSSHTVPVPKGGGAGIVAAWVVGMVLLADGRLTDPAYAGVLLAGMFVAAVSYLDDLYDWPFLIKLAAQAIAAAAIIACGIRIQILHLPWFGAIDTGLLGLPLTAAWIVFVTNAINFIDGLNGLASGTAAIAGIVLAIAATAAGTPALATPALLLAVAIAGFLPFNYPHARIFMGDVGSQFCGFVLAILGISASRASASALSVLLIPLVLSPVLFDVAFTLLRRARAGDRLTEAHRGHLYQVANRAGLPAWRVTLIYWAMAVWGGGLALAMPLLPAASRATAPFLVLPPFIGWAFWIARAANQRKLAKW